MTLDELKSEIAKRYTGEDTIEAQLLWYISYSRACELHDYGIKDMARILNSDGLQPTTMELAEQWLEEYFEDDGEMRESLISDLDNFYS